MIDIRGHFDGVVFVPDEPVDLPRNQPVVLHVELTPPPEPPPADAWDVLARNAGSVQAPTDWAGQHDHYLYGTPKRPPNPPGGQP